MKTSVPIIFSLLFILTSCSNNDIQFNKKTFYKASQNNDSTQLYLSFLSDTVAVMNSDSMKYCNWQFLKLFEDELGFYFTQEYTIDKFRLTKRNNKIIITSTSDTTEFKKITFKMDKIDSIRNLIISAKELDDKGISYSCEYSLKEVIFFYDWAVEKTKNNLKNPNSAKFIKTYIHKYKRYVMKNHEFIPTDITCASLDIEAKNGFGAFIENTYYVYFIPSSSSYAIGGYEIRLSDSPIMEEDYGLNY